MATTVESDLKIYDPRVQGGFHEGIYQAIDAFNASSQGAIRFKSDRKPGDFDYTAFWQDVSGLITRRDMTSIAAATALKATQGEMVNVKVNRKIGPVDVARGSLVKAGFSINDDGAQFALGQTVAAKVMQDRLNTGLLALVAALTNQAAVTYDGSADTTPTMSSDKLPKGLRKFGDASDDIVMWVMHSEAWFDLFEDQLGSTVTGIGNVLLYEARPGTLNRPTLVLDSPSLINTTPTPDEYTTLGLTSGAIEIEDTEGEYIVQDVITGLEQIVHRMQGEYATNYGIKGFAYDVANGGANPTDATIGTGSNWDPVVASHKGYSGCAIITQ